MSKIKVALIEDEQITSKVVSEELREAGFEVVQAFDGFSGIQLIKSEMPDAVLLDIMMPKMTGFDVLKAMKSDSVMKNIPVLVLTVLSDDENLIKARKFGIDDYIVKTKQKVAEIPEKIKKILNKEK